MNAREIEEGLVGSLGDGVIFLGCHVEGNIRNLLHYARQQSKASVFFLFIEGSSTAEVGHWVAVYINFANKGMGYFDTYNLHPALTSPTFYSYLRKLPKLKFSTLAYRIQSMKTLVCGIYCMYFCYLLSHNNTITQVWRLMHRTFKKNKFLSNDKSIVRLAYRLFKIPHCSKIFCNGGANMMACMRRLCT